jgi:hypothetical protein
MGEKSADGKESFWTKFLLATLPAIVVAYATNQLTKKHADGEKQEIRHDLAVQLSKSLELSNEKLNHWIEKYENLSNKYDELRQRVGGAAPIRRSGGNGATVSNLTESDPEPARVRATSLDGTWKTPDGTVVWTFSNGRLQVVSSDLLPGMLSGSGTYHQTGDVVQGDINLNVAFYLPVNQLMRFNGQVLGDGRTITGTSTDPNGTVSAISLHR